MGELTERGGKYLILMIQTRKHCKTLESTVRL